MFHLLKVFSLATFVVALSASPAIAHDKVDRSRSISEETLMRIGKDLAELQRAVEKATEDLAEPPRDIRIVCDNPSLSILTYDPWTEIDNLRQQGYAMTGTFARDFVYVGTGLRLVRSQTMAVLVDDTVPGSSAHATGFFQKEERFHIKAVDGISTLGQTGDKIQAMLIGDAAPGTGVVITVAKEKGSRDYDRFLMRTRMKLKNMVQCVRLEVPKK